MSKFYIFPLSDLHLGAVNCNLDFFNKWCRTFEKAPENKCIYLLGDLLEFPTTRIDSYAINLSTTEALERIIELLYPYKRYIRYVASGNHEIRSMKEFNLDITYHIATNFNSKYTKNDFFDTIKVGNKKLKVYGKHGTSTSKSPDLAMKNFKVDMDNIDADLYMMGHNHYCEFSSKFQRGQDGGRRKYYAFTGAFLNYENSYAHDKGYLISQPAFMRLSVDKKLHVDCKKYYYDEVM